MSYQISVPPLDVIDGDRRLEVFATLERRLRRLAGGSIIARFNARVLNIDAVLFDLQWLAITHDRFIAIGVPDLNLPAEPSDAATAALVTRVTRVLPDVLLHPALESEAADLPKVPTWGFNNQPLANPFLEELNELPGIIEDRLWLKKHRPELAELLELEARGGPSYREFFQTEEREKLLKAAREFTGQNPFVAGDDGSEPSTATHNRHAAIAELSRTNPVLAEQLKREAGLPGINPWGKRAHNMSNRMRFEKADEKLSAMLRAAGAYEESQVAFEVREAEEQARRLREQADATRARARRA